MDCRADQRCPRPGSRRVACSSSVPVSPASFSAASTAGVAVDRQDTGGSGDHGPRPVRRPGGETEQLKPSWSAQASLEHRRHQFDAAAGDGELSDFRIGGGGRYACYAEAAGTGIHSPRCRDRVVTLRCWFPALMAESGAQPVMLAAAPVRRLKTHRPARVPPGTERARRRTTRRGGTLFPAGPCRGAAAGRRWPAAVDRLHDL